MKTWNVVLHGEVIGQVCEDSERLARLAALCKYGAVEGETEGIQMDDEFSVVLDT